MGSVNCRSEKWKVHGYENVIRHWEDDGSSSNRAPSMRPAFPLTCLSTWILLLKYSWSVFSYRNSTKHKKEEKNSWWVGADGRDAWVVHKVNCIKKALEEEKDAPGKQGWGNSLFFLPCLLQLKHSSFSSLPFFHNKLAWLSSPMYLLSLFVDFLFDLYSSTHMTDFQYESPQI